MLAISALLRRSAALQPTQTLLPPPDKNGFTLAEVLITLVIIGVITAITVPTLITKYQKEQTVTRLKKAYSTLAQTTALAISEHGPISTWEVDNDTFADKFLVPYLSVGKNCRFDNTSDTCVFKYATLKKPTVFYTQGNNVYRFYLNDGTFVSVYVSVIKNYNFTLPDESIFVGNRTFANLMVDINGQRKPNTFGKDIFEVRYEIYTNVPYLLGQIGKFSSPDSTSLTRDEALNHPNWGCNKEAAGDYCLQVIMADGWQIKDDYPW